MSILTLLSTTLIGLLAISCSNDTQPDNSITFGADGTQFSMEMPTGWVLDIEHFRLSLMETHPDVLAVFFIGDRLDDEYKNALELFRFSVPPPTPLLRDYKAEYERSIARNPKIDVIDSEYTKFADFDAVSVTITGTKDDEPFTTTHIAFIQEPWIWFMQCVTTGDSSPMHSQICDPPIESIELLPG